MIRALLLFVVVGGVYLFAVRNEFLYDDHEVIQNHPGPRSLSEVARIFREPHFPNLPYYRPITRTTLLLQKTIWGDDTTPFHVFNAALMGLAAVLAYALLRLPVFRYDAMAAWLAAAMFALHPVASSCVYPTSSGRETLMPAVWILAAMNAWLRPGWRFKVAAYVAFAGALLSKEQSVVLPLLWLLSDVLGIAADPPGRKPRNWLLRYLPLIPVLAGYFAVRHALFGGTEYVPGGWTGPLLSVLYALQSIFVPFFALHYEPALEVWISPVRLAIALLATGALIWVARKQAVWWCGWFLLALLPTANVLHQEAPYDERYVFLASLGIFALLAEALPRRREWQIAGACLVGLMAALSAHRTVYFRDDIAFSEQWLATNPRSVNAEYNFGYSLAKRGDYPGAVDHYRKALLLRPDYVYALNNLANALVAQGRITEALPYFREAVRLDPRYFDGHYNLGLALCQSGAIDECVGSLTRATELRSNSTVALVNLGGALAMRGDVERAAAVLERALTLDPDSAEAHNNDANALARRGDLDRAVAQYREALRLNPDLADARRNLELVQAAQH